MTSLIIPGFGIVSHHICMKKKFFDKERKKLILNTGFEDIEYRSRHLKSHMRRNENINHVNYKIQHLLYDPFTFINAYTKISKNKGARH